jgi:hypothetical protein
LLVNHHVVALEVTFDCCREAAEPWDVLDRAPCY